MTSVFAWLRDNYQWLPSLYTLLGMAGLLVIVGRLKALSPTFREAAQINSQTYKERMTRPSYAANQKWNRGWAPLTLIAVFVVVMPFCLTLAPPPWWRVPLDAVVILLVYDFVYYVVHRFVFHDSAFMGGPLKWMHAVHHQQHNPCRGDAGYIHPLESAIGLGLFVGSMFVLSRFMGEFHVVTVVLAWFVFAEINVQNHALWQADHGPFKFLHYASKMHHHHHARFTGGNFATITVLFDWMFGTLDNGDGYKAAKGRKDAKVGVAE